MPENRKRLTWVYDEDLQQFTVPGGRIITLWEIAQLFYDQIIAHHDFQGPWTGWRMRGEVLIPPGSTARGSNLKPHNTQAFNRWLETAALSDMTPEGRKAGIRLAYSSERGLINPTPALGLTRKKPRLKRTPEPARVDNVKAVDHGHAGQDEPNIGI